MAFAKTRCKGASSRILESGNYAYVVQSGVAKLQLRATLGK